MKTITLKTFIFLIFCFISTTLNIFCQEEAVSFDNKNKVFTLTPEVEKNLGLYSGSGSFKEAELFKENDSTYILEIHYIKENKVFRERKNLSVYEVTSIKKKVDEIVSTNVNSSDIREGRMLLLGASLYTGLTIYGNAVPIMFNVQNDFRTYIGLYMLGAGSCFFIPYFATKDIPVSYGQANLVNYGLSRGFLHGVLYANALDNNATAQTIFSLGTLFGVGESLLGFNLVKKYNISNGNANLMTVYGDFGFYTGFAISSQLNLFQDSKGQGIAALAATGSIAGLMTGYYIGREYPVSAGDAEIINTTAILGAFMPLSIIDYFKPSKSWVYTTPSLITGIAGLYIGHQLTKNYDFTFSQGYITKLGTLAGGLIGLGTAYLIFGENGSGYEYLLGSYLGAQASFILLHNINLKAMKSNELGKLDFHLMPENYFLGKNFRSTDLQFLGMFPLASLTYKL